MRRYASCLFTNSTVSGLTRGSLRSFWPTAKRCLSVALSFRKTCTVRSLLTFSV
jgi:hypothetical protein